ncbi:MAG TPA: hypothetical protein VIJ42_13945 [Stellaceae bacterium]
MLDRKDFTEEQWKKMTAPGAKFDRKDFTKEQWEKLTGPVTDEELASPLFREINELTRREALEKEIAPHLRIREAYRWVLEFIRNAMVIAALAYLAYKSGSWFVWTIAGFAQLVLCGHTSTYIDIWVARFSFSKASPKTAGAIAAGGTLLQCAISAALFFAINKIVEAQLH